MNSHNSLKVDVSGVAPEKQEDAEKELRQIFEAICSIDGVVGINVIISSDFDRTVNAILQKERDVQIKYDSERSQVKAFGKIIPVKRENGIGFYAVFDGRILGGWENDAYFWRLTPLMHESLHIGDMVALFNGIGTDVFFSEPSTVNDVFNALAYDIWMEYHAERMSIEIFEKMAKETHPQADINYGLHQGYVDSLDKTLSDFPEFLIKKRNEFKNWQITMDEFWPNVFSRLREILVLAAFTSGQSDARGKQLLKINKQDTFFALFLDAWSEILERFHNLHDTRNPYDPIAFEAIGHILRSLFESCGMTCRDTEQGVYIEIRPLGCIGKFSECVSLVQDSMKG